MGGWDRVPKKQQDLYQYFKRREQPPTFGIFGTGTNLYQLCVDQTSWMCVYPSPSRLEDVSGLGAAVVCVLSCDA